MKKLLIIAFLLVFPCATMAAGQMESLGEKLQGKIILQVENNGEAWYINPADQMRYFLGRPADAFNLMRELGLGISNKDFDAFNMVAPAKLAGKILLKVESNGEAYYVNPVDFKMYYLGRPADAFKVMRELGLGISNNDIGKITIKEGRGISQNNQVEEADSSASIEPIEEVDEAPIDTEENIEESDEMDSETEVVEVSTTTEEIATTTEEIEVSATSSMFLAEYFSYYKPLGKPSTTTYEAEINHDWGTDAPDGVSRKDRFSVKWTKTVFFEAGTYKFYATVNDGVKLYINGGIILNKWDDRSRAITISNGKVFDEDKEVVIKVEYYDNTGDAECKVWWERIE